MNEDGAANGLDADPFVAAVVGADTQPIPEPSSLLLGTVALGFVVVSWKAGVMRRLVSVAFA